jgi:hypothetical protein
MKSFLLSLSSSQTSKQSICRSGLETVSLVGSEGDCHTGLKPLSSIVSVLNVWGAATPSALVRVTCWVESYTGKLAIEGCPMEDNNTRDKGGVGKAAIEEEHRRTTTNGSIISPSVSWPGFGRHCPLSTYKKNCVRRADKARHGDHTLTDILNPGSAGASEIMCGGLST